MKLFIDLGLRRFVESPGFNSSPRALGLKRGDTGVIQIQFCRGRSWWSWVRGLR